MTYFLCKAGGLLAGSFAWSIGSTAYSTNSEASVAASWDAAILGMWQLTAFAAFISEDTTLTYTSASTASATFKQTTKTTTDHNIAGTSTSPCVGYRTSMLVTFRSAYATRWGRGRWFLPGPADNALATTGYELSTAASTAVADAVDAFFTDLGPNVSLQILHRKGSLDGTVAPNSVSPVTAADTPNLFGTQRRRADKQIPTRISISV
jgi:hypothetical protein